MTIYLLFCLRYWNVQSNKILSTIMTFQWVTNWTIGGVRWPLLHTTWRLSCIFSIVRRKHCFGFVCSKTRHYTVMTSRLEKERSKQIQEKCQNLLIQMLRDEDNKYCVDCDAKGSCINCIFSSNVLSLFNWWTLIILFISYERCRIIFL